MPTQDQLERLAAVVPAAQASARATGVPASVTLAQWILESAWGASQLARTCNNFFGVKCTARLAGNYMEFPTAEYESGRRVLIEALFAKYPSAAAAFAAHAALIAGSPRYRPAMQVKSNPDSFAVALQRCGYSTNPTYAHELMDLIHELVLTRYDVPPPVPTAAIAKAA